MVDDVAPSPLSPPPPASPLRRRLSPPVSRAALDWGAALPYCRRPIPLALAAASPRLRRRAEQLNWIALIASEPPRIASGIGRRARRCHHDALRLDRLWRGGRLSERPLAIRRAAALLAEDTAGTCHAFLPDGGALSPALLHWLARAFPPPLRPPGEGAGRGGQRPLALHVAAAHMPWLAKALVADVPQLAELYCTLDGGRVPPPRGRWLWVAAMLAAHPQLRVLSITPRHPNAPRRRGEDDVWAPYVHEIGHNGAQSNASPSSQTFSETNEQGELSQSNGYGNTCGVSRGSSVGRAGEKTEWNCEDEPFRLCASDMRALSLLLPHLEVLYLCPSPIDTLDMLEPPDCKVSALRELYLLCSTPLPTSLSGSGKWSGTHRIGDWSATALSFLEVLWVEGAAVQKQLPSILLSCTTSTLTALREVHVVLDTTFTTSSLSGLERLPTLEVLHLERVCVDLLGFMGASPSLGEVLIHACRVSSAMALNGIERAPLEHMSMAYTENLRSVTCLSHCPSLRRLLLTRCNGIGTVSIEGLHLLPQLELLALEYTRIDSTEQLAASPSLQHLRLDGCKRILRGSIRGLNACTTLCYLSLQDTNVLDVEALYASRSLTELDLCHCRHLEQAGVEGLGEIPSLRVLRLSYTPIESVSFLRCSAALTELYLDHCPQLNSDGLRGLEEIPSLHTLSVRHSEVVNISFLGNCPRLEVLHVASMERLRTNGIEGLERCATLRHLNMAFCGVSSVTCLAAGCQRLQYLNLRGCQRLTSKGLEGLDQLPVLTEIILDELDLLEDINGLANCQSLRWISAIGCILLTLQGVQELFTRANPVYLNL